jgi:hypothetical protein
MTPHHYFYIGLLLLAGCQSDGMTLQRPMTPTTIITMEVMDAKAQCAAFDARDAIACSVRNYQTKTCVIILPMNAKFSTVEHERLHCFGYEHS